MELNWLNLIVMLVTIGTVLTPIAVHLIKSYVTKEIHKLKEKKVEDKIDKLEKEIEKK